MPYTLGQLVDPCLLQSIADSLFQSSGFPMAVLDAEGEILATVGWQDICVKFHRAEKRSRVRCRESDARVYRKIPLDGHVLYKCKNGLWDAAMPLVVDGNHMGTLFLGQFLFNDENVDVDRFRAQAREFGYDEAAYLEALERVPRHTRHDLEQCMESSKRFVQLVAQVCMDNRRLKEENARRREAEQAAVANENLYRLLADNMEDAIFIIGPDETYQYVSPSATQMSGYTADEFNQMCLKDHISDESHAKARELFEQVGASFAAGTPDMEPKRLELEVLRKDGSRVWTEVVAKPLVDAEGNWTASLGMARDIDQRKRMERELQSSRLRYGAFLQALPDMLFLFDGQGRFLDVHAPPGSALLAPREALLGKSCREVLPPYLADLTEEKLALARTTNESQEYDYSLDIGGEKKWFECRLVAAGPEEYLAIVREVTEDRRQKRELEESRARQEEYGRKLLKESNLNKAVAEVAKFMTSPRATLPVIADLILAMALEATGSEMGYVASVGEGGMTKVESFITGDADCGVREQGPDRETHLPGGLCSVALRLGRPFYTNDPAAHSEYTGVPEGHVALDRFLAVPALYEGQVVGQIAVTGAGRDFTDADARMVANLADLLALGLARKRHELDLLRQKELAEQGNNAKREFLALMSHELRTPLNGIFGMLQLLADSDLDEAQAEFVHISRHSASGLMAVIQDILDYAKAEAGQLNVHEEEFSVYEVLKDARNNFIVAARERHVDVKLDVDPDMAPSIRGVKQRIRQVVFNLLGNAVKFTSHGEVCVRASLARSPKGARLVVSVEDSGVGIPRQRMAETFNPFTQMESTFTRRHGGIGLGLGIVRKLMELMGGDLCLDSVEGEGTLAYFSVPVVEPESGARCLSGATPLKVETASPARILLVEDDRINRHSTMRMLRGMGYAVLAARDGEEALSMLATNAVDCVLMDIQMPVMDGMEATRAIRGNPEIADLPVIALTAHAMSGDKKRFLEAGMDDYLSKPVNIKDLRAAIEGVLGAKA